MSFISKIFGGGNRSHKIYVTYTTFRNFEEFEKFCKDNKVVGDSVQLWARLEAYGEITLFCS